MTGFAGLDTVLRNRQRDRDRKVGRGRERKIKGERVDQSTARTVTQEEESFSDFLFMICDN